MARKTTDDKAIKPRKKKAADENLPVVEMGSLEPIEALPKTVDLSNPKSLDLSNLSLESQQQVAERAQEAQLDLHKKAGEAQIDILGTKANLDNFNETVREASKDGSSITLTHTQNTSTGRTEVVMGNTEKAAAGKISRSGLGLEDNTVKIIAVIAAAVVLAVIFLG